MSPGRRPGTEGHPTRQREVWYDQPWAISLLAVLAMGTVGAALVITFMTSRTIIAYTFAASLVGVAGLILSGNPRLVALWGLALTAPIEYSKYFRTAKHMGGEYSFRIEVSDFFLAGMLFYVVMDMVQSRDWRVRVPKAAWMWMVLMAMGAFTAGFGTFRLVATMEVVRNAKLLLLFLVVANGVVRRRQFEHMVAALVGWMFVQGIYGLGQYFFNLNLGLDRLGESAIRSESLGNESRRRIGALLGHPNVLSGYLSMVMPLSLAILFSKVSLWLRIMAAVALPAAAGALVLTLSRNGWLSTAAGSVVVVGLSLFHRGIRVRTTAMRVVLISGGTVALAFASEIIIKRFLRSDPMNLDARWKINKVAFKMIMDKPLLGHGENSTAYVMTSNPRYHLDTVSELSRNPEVIPPIHNIYLSQLAEQGAIGLIIFLTMFWFVIKAALGNLKVRDETVYAINMGLLGGLVGIMMHGLIDWVWYFNPITRSYWLFAGLVMAITYWRLRGELEGERGPGG